LLSKAFLRFGFASVRLAMRPLGVFDAHFDALGQP
jgi:hypothetical protein